MAGSTDEEKEHLYSIDNPDSETSHEDIVISRWPTRRQRWLACLPRLAMLVISLSAAFTMGFFLANMVSPWSVNRAYSPAASALMPTIRYFDLNKHSPYSGRPNANVDLAWTELLKHSNVRLTEAEMDAIAPDRKLSDAVELPDGGYMAMLEVHHELHCVKHLRRYLYADYYFPNLTAAQLDLRREHLDHCLDILRETLLCHADVAPLTMRWGHLQPVPGANFTIPHSCNSWESIDNWAKERSIDRIFEPGYLKHPVLGDVYTWKDFDMQARLGLVHDGIME